MGFLVQSGPGEGAPGAAAALPAEEAGETDGQGRRGGRDNDEGEQGLDHRFDFRDLSGDPPPD